MTAPSKLRMELLKELRATRKDMSSYGWHFRIKNKPEEIQRRAAFVALDVESAIRALENEQLAEIRDKLIENEPDLLAGLADLNQARKNLARVQSVISTAGKALDVLAKVVKFAVARL